MTHRDEIGMLLGCVDVLAAENARLHRRVATLDAAVQSLTLRVGTLEERVLPARITGGRIVEIVRQPKQARVFTPALVAS